MFESLIESRRNAHPLWRPATLGTALGLHLCLLGTVMVENSLRAAPPSEPLKEVAYLRFAPRPVLPVVGPPASEASAIEAPAAETPVVTAEPETRLPTLPTEHETTPLPREVVQPQRLPEVIHTDPIPARATTSPANMGRGVEGGVPGGVPNGIRGGTTIPAGPIWAGGDVTAPIVLERVQPIYPARAQSARIEGAVKLEAVILRDGTVGDIRVIQGLRLGCTEAAIAALKQWRFRPGEYRGAPADVYFELTVDFILN